jgi:asparagine synthase (glutamine-hydrolysing)
LCGIVGSNFIPNISFDIILNPLLNRGIDSKGIKIYQNIFLAHTRLSIIDLNSQANQPMQYDNIIIVFNISPV